ncbi:hypothetical protein BH10ACT1_BH10ACT1_18200 [soil metagenome]
MGLGGRLTEPSYVRALGLFHGLWTPTEEAIARWSVGRDVRWPLEGRARLARHDLLVLGVSAAAISELPCCDVERLDPGAEGAATAFGYAYVLEGSARGAAVIARRLADELPEAPDSFLASREPGRWPAFKKSLDQQAWSEASQERAADAANRLFAALTAIASGAPGA